MLTLGGNCECCCPCSVCSPDCGNVIEFNVTISGSANGASNTLCSCNTAINASFAVGYLSSNDDSILSEFECSFSASPDVFCFWSGLSVVTGQCSGDAGGLFTLSSARILLYRDSGNVRMRFQMKVNSSLPFGVDPRVGYVYFDVSLGSGDTLDCTDIDENQALSSCGNFHLGICTLPTSARVEFGRIV